MVRLDDGGALQGIGARISLGGCDGLGWSMTAPGGLVGVGSGWPLGSGQVTSIVVRYVGPLAW
jgi:hypothetical protein